MSRHKGAFLMDINRIRTSLSGTIAAGNEAEE